MENIFDTQLQMGPIENPFLSRCKKSKPAPMGDRTEQILYSMCTGNPLQEPEVKNGKLYIAMQYPKERQMRYFAAWAHDQYERVAVELKQTTVPLDESVIQTYEKDILAALYHEFETGKAYDYVDEWYSSFPNGGYFNPVRYNNLYKDEMGIAHRVEEYIQCGQSSPAINLLLESTNKPEKFDHSFVQNGGAFIVNFASDADVHKILLNSIPDIEEHVAETIGEDETINHDQRIFVTNLYDYGDTSSACAVLYSGFDTDSEYELMGSVKNAIVEAIPVDYWRDSRLSVSTEPYAITKGELDMAKLNAPVCHDHMYDYENTRSYEDYLNESIDYETQIQKNKPDVNFVLC